MNRIPWQLDNGAAADGAGIPLVDNRADGVCTVVQFQRKSASGAFSVERMFDDIREALPPDIRAVVHVNRHLSRGILGRVRDMLRAMRLRGEVNHVLGDVHYLMLLLPRRRSVLTILDCVSLERLGSFRRWVFQLLWYRLPLRKACQVTVISEFTRQSVIRLGGYPPERIHVIPPPLSREFVRQPRQPHLGRQRVLQVGTGANKNLERVMEAVQGLDVLLVIIGELSTLKCERLRALGISFENHVRLSREALVEQYRLADVVVFASLYEGFGLPIVEAQAIGRPVVTSRLDPMPEVAGGAACLVDPLDVADIRRGLCAVLDNPVYAANLVQGGFSNVERFAPDRIAEQYAIVYRQVQAEARGEV